MAVRGAGNIVVTYNAQDITAYVNQVDLATTVAELEASALNSATGAYVPGLVSYTLGLSGDWAKAGDDILGVDAMTAPRRAVIVKFTDSTGAWVQYSWSNTGNYGFGFITGYNISGGASGKIEQAPSIRLSGAPNRTTG